MTNKDNTTNGEAAGFSTNDHKGLFSKSLSTWNPAALIVIHSISFYEARGQITEYSIICGTIPAN